MQSIVPALASLAIAPTARRISTGTGVMVSGLKRKLGAEPNQASIATNRRSTR